MVLRAFFAMPAMGGLSEFWSDLKHRGVHYNGFESVPPVQPEDSEVVFPVKRKRGPIQVGKATSLPVGKVRLKNTYIIDLKRLLDSSPDQEVKAAQDIGIDVKNSPAKTALRNGYYIYGYHNRSNPYARASLPRGDEIGREWINLTTLEKEEGIDQDVVRHMDKEKKKILLHIHRRTKSMYENAADSSDQCKERADPFLKGLARISHAGLVHQMDRAQFPDELLWYPSLVNFCWAALMFRGGEDAKPTRGKDYGGKLIYYPGKVKSVLNLEIDRCLHVEQFGKFAPPSAGNKSNSHVAGSSGRPG